MPFTVNVGFKNMAGPQLLFLSTPLQCTGPTRKNVRAYFTRDTINNLDLIDLRLFQERFVPWIYESSL